MSEWTDKQVVAAIEEVFPDVTHEQFQKIWEIMEKTNPYDPGDDDS